MSSAAQTSPQTNAITADNLKADKTDDYSPLGIFLVKSGSNGEKLLFRFPYAIDEMKNELDKKGKSRYALMTAEDIANQDKTSGGKGGALTCSESGPAPMPPPSELTASLTSTTSTGEGLRLVVGFVDSVLANMFAVSSKLCGQKFELKINDVRFVGHPMLLSSKSADSDLLTFNIVFALKATASHDVVNSYHDLSQRIAIALCYEENRYSYLTKEATVMGNAHDEIQNLLEDGDSHSDSPYQLIMGKQVLALNYISINRQFYLFRNTFYCF